MNVNIAQRLRNARLMNGFSMDELCNRLGDIITKQAISKYESGKVVPDSNMLIRLANALGVNVDYFFRRTSVALDGIEFRKTSKLGNKKIAGLKEQIRDRVERYIEIEDIYNINSDFDTNVSENEISQEEDVYPIVNRLKRDWNLGDDGINGVIEMLETHKIKVIEIKVEGRAFDGLSGRVDDKKPFVVLNSTSNSERKRFTALHELGHLLLNFREGLDKDKIEHLCHLFASEMLISKDVFMNIIGPSRKGISMQELIGMQTQYGISIDALMYKAMYLNVITESRHTYYCIMKNKNAEFKKTVETSRYKEEKTTRFEGLVYRALASEMITASKASSLLNEPLEKVLGDLELV